MLAPQTWTETCCTKALDHFQINREAYYAHPDATPYIGSASSRMHKFVRHELEVSFMSNKVIFAPRDEESEFNWGEPKHKSKRGVTMGGMIAKVYGSMRTGQFYRHFSGCVSDVHNFKCAAEKALAINQDENTKFFYAKFKSSELYGSRSKAQNLSPTVTIIDDTLYHLDAEAQITPKVTRSGYDT